MITFQEETLSQNLIEEAEDILKLHAEELPDFSFSPEPNWRIYQQLEYMNTLHIVTVRDDKKLVGYCVSIIVFHHRYKNTVVAENDLHYLLPEYRKGWTGYKFLKEVIRLLKNHNVNVILHNMKASHSYLPLTERLGFKLIEYKVAMEV